VLLGDPGRIAERRDAEHATAGGADPTVAELGARVEHLDVLARRRQPVIGSPRRGSAG
jgi:hypothetical protein